MHLTYWISSSMPGSGHTNMNKAWPSTQRPLIVAGNTNMNTTAIMSGQGVT